MENAGGDEHDRDSENRGEEVSRREITPHGAEKAWVHLPLIAQEVVIAQERQRSADAADE
jgi:hypothetical protein